jgi:hypothetical protein
MCAASVGSSRCRRLPAFLGLVRLCVCGVRVWGSRLAYRYSCTYKEDCLEDKGQVMRSITTAMMNGHECVLVVPDFSLQLQSSPARIPGSLDGFSIMFTIRASHVIASLLLEIARLSSTLAGDDLFLR